MGIKKERGVAEFSTESEYVIHAKASNENIYLLNFLTELFGNCCPITSFDCKVTIKLTVSNVYHKISKHNDYRFPHCGHVKEKHISTQLHSYVSAQTHKIK
jgi:hypothetical protein